MHLLYLDESGQHGGDYFVLAGLAVFERQTYWLSDEDKIQAHFFPNAVESIVFHASEIRGGRKSPWNEMAREKRHQLIDKVYRVVSESKSTLFAIAVERQALHDEDEYEYAFESLLTRFDQYLSRLYRETDERHKGIVIVAESSYKERIETVAGELRRHGTRWRELTNLCEVPLFTPATNSRILQAADFCANAVWSRYEHGQSRHFDQMVAKFDSSDGIIHGLFHFHRARNRDDCYCPACMCRRTIDRTRATG